MRLINLKEFQPESAKVETEMPGNAEIFRVALTHSKSIIFRVKL